MSIYFSRAGGYRTSKIACPTHRWGAKEKQRGKRERLPPFALQPVRTDETYFSRIILLVSTNSSVASR
jgi:hypothetical protein